MNLTVYSRNRILDTFPEWNVCREFADPMYNYLVYGYNPGRCFTAVLANDFMAAITSSHPLNTIEAFKSLTGWIHDKMPKESYGSYPAVNHWSNLADNDRRQVLENHNLIYTSKEEVLMALKGKTSVEPVFF